MKPLKAVLFFLYCIAALTAIGTSISHVWQTRVSLVQEEKQLAAVSPS